MKVEVTDGKLISETSFDRNGLNSNIKQNFSIWGLGFHKRDAELKKKRWLKALNIYEATLSRVHAMVTCCTVFDIDQGESFILSV